MLQLTSRHNSLQTLNISSMRNKLRTFVNGNLMVETIIFYFPIHLVWKLKKYIYICNCRFQVCVVQYVEEKCNNSRAVTKKKMPQLDSKCCEIAGGGGSHDQRRREEHRCPAGVGKNQILQAFSTSSPPHSNWNYYMARIKMGPQSQNPAASWPDGLLGGFRGS